MNICIKCQKELVCKTNSVTAVFAGDHCYQGDVFRCPGCNVRVLINCGQPYFDPEALGKPETINMDEVPE